MPSLSGVTPAIGEPDVWRTEYLRTFVNRVASTDTSAPRRAGADPREQEPPGGRDDS